MVSDKPRGGKRNEQGSSSPPINDKEVFDLFDDLNLKIARELITNPNISSTNIAEKYGISLSTIQRRRAKLEQVAITKTYNLDLQKLGWRTADLLISVQKGKTEETAQNLLNNKLLSFGGF